MKVLNISWPELCRDLERAVEFDQSQLFRKVYEEEFGMPGGEPYGLLVIDHEIRHRPFAGAPTDDVNALAQLPGSPPRLSCRPCSPPPRPSCRSRNSPISRWSMELSDPFRGSRIRPLAQPLVHARTCGLSAVTLPRVLARPPWEDDPARADGFRYAEYAPDIPSRVWMTAGYSFAAVVARAFVNHAWPADVRGSETDFVGAGLVTDLPIEPFRTDPDHVWVRPPLDLVLSGPPGGDLWSRPG